MHTALACTLQAIETILCNSYKVYKLIALLSCVAKYLLFPTE